MDLVSIVIPTFNRHNALRRALASAAAQEMPAGFMAEIIVADNSSDANARGIVEEFENSAIPFVYLNEPRPGVATARNAGVRAARGRWVAFLDDDEEAPARWLAELVAIARTTGACAVFGPVEARSDGGGEIGALAPYFSRYSDQPDGADITRFAAYLGTNNSMFERETCFCDGEPFDTSLNETGGEDSLLIQRLVLRGLRFAWAAKANVVEWAAPKRLNWSYVRKRKFLSGQIRVFVQHMARPGRWDRIGLWMAIGLAQFVFGGVAALAAWPLDGQRSARMSAMAWGGLGKVLWARRFRPALYGSGLVN